MVRSLVDGAKMRPRREKQTETVIRRAPDPFVRSGEKINLAIRRDPNDTEYHTAYSHC